LRGPMVEAEQTGKGNQMTVTNNQRAEWAAAALKHFQTLTGTDHADSLADLLCDIHHWCDRENTNFQSALDRARQHYDAEFSADSMTPYMATFNTPAGTATEIFHAKSPDEALQQARKFADDPQLTEVDIEPTAEGYAVREIVLTDEQGNHHAVWQTDEYRTQLAAPKLLQALEKQIGITREILDAWNNTDHLYGAVEDLISELDSKSQWAQEVLRASERCDLTAPIEDLEKSLDETLDAVAQAKGGAV
jgi:hypothetical protein